jgi:general secretion pathway protein F
VNNFYYEAIHSNGKTVKGYVKADSLQGAREQLRAKGFIPIELRERNNKSFFSFQLQRVTKQDLSLVTRQLATLLAAGIPIEEAIHGVSEQTDKTKVRHILEGVRNKILEGYSLAQALNDYPAFFPDLYRTTVNAGEQTGRLDSILENLADYIEKQQLTKQKVQQALIYPIIMMIVSGSIITFLLTYIVPSMIQVFSDTGQTLPLSTIVLIGISHFLQTYGIYLLILIIMMVVVFRRLLKKPKNKLRFDKFLLKVPMIAYIIRSVNVARYIHTFSILFAAGVNVLETMRISAHLIQNLEMREAFQEATFKVREGRDISSALKDTQFMPPMALHLISSGEKSGELASMMKRSAQHLDQEMTRLIDTGMTLLEPFMIIVMGGVVMFIVLATLLPIFSMEQMVG